MKIKRQLGYCSSSFSWPDPSDRSPSNRSTRSRKWINMEEEDGRQRADRHEVYLIWCDWGTPTFGAWMRPGQWLYFWSLPASAHCGLWPFSEETTKEVKKKKHNHSHIITNTFKTRDTINTAMGFYHYIVEKLQLPVNHIFWIDQFSFGTKGREKKKKE